MKKRYWFRAISNIAVQPLRKVLFGRIADPVASCTSLRCRSVEQNVKPGEGSIFAIFKRTQRGERESDENDLPDLPCDRDRTDRKQ